VPGNTHCNRTRNACFFQPSASRPSQVVKQKPGDPCQGAGCRPRFPKIPDALLFAIVREATVQGEWLEQGNLKCPQNPERQPCGNPSFPRYSESLAIPSPTALRLPLNARNSGPQDTHTRNNRESLFAGSPFGGPRAADKQRGICSGPCGRHSE
jgi:hypothetical protein